MNIICDILRRIMYRVLTLAAVIYYITIVQQVQIASCDDTTIDPDAAKSTDKDPWEKWSKLPSSGKAHSNSQNNNDDSDEGEVDVTETTTTEVHTKSKINNNDKKRRKEAKATSTNTSINPKVDSETKEQFKDAVDETVRAFSIFLLMIISKAKGTL